MRKSILFILILCFIVSGGSFERPWNSYSWVAENPNIFYFLGHSVWMNTDGFHESMQTLDPEPLNDVEDGELADKLGAVSDAKSEEDYEYHRCKESLAVLNLSDPDGQALLLMSSSGVPGLLASSAIRAYAGTEAVEHCFNRYPETWKDATDKALSAVEWSERKAEESIDSAYDSYLLLRFAGVCDNDYTKAGSEGCAELESAFIGINTSEGVANKALMDDYHESLQSDLMEHLPGFELFYSEMVLVWGENGTVEKYDTLEEKAAESLEKAEVYFEELEENATETKNRAKKKLDGLGDEKLNKISTGMKELEFGAVGTISERFERQEEKYDDAEIQYDYSNSERERINKEGYLKNSINGMGFAYDLFYEVELALEELEEDAGEVVNEQKEDAEELLAEAGGYISEAPRSTEAINHYQDALSEFSEGEDAKKLGEKFQHYYNSAAHARACINERSIEEEFDVEGKISELEDLINRANDDEIDTFTEQEMLELLKKQKNIQGVVEILQEIEESIISKAKAKYDDELKERRERILEKIQLAGNVAADLITSMDNAGNGIIENGEVDYPSAIGKLRDLLEIYIETEEMVDHHIKEVLEGAMEKEEKVFVTGAELDKEATITLDVVLSNPTPYNASGIEVPVYLDRPVLFFFSEITEGSGYVSSVRSEDNGKTMVVVLKEVQPYANYPISFEKNAVVAHTEEAERIAVGTGNEQAKVEEIIEFYLDVGIDSLVLPEEFENANIDGFDANRPLESGEHVLTSSYVLDDAYEEVVENIVVSPLGINSKIEFTIRFRPGINLDSVLFFIETTGETESQDLQLYSSGGEEISEPEEVSERLYRSEIFGLEEERETSVFVNYIVYNVSDIIEDEMVLLESQQNISDDAQGYIDNAKDALAAEDYASALENIENAKKLIREEAKKNSKLTKKIEDRERKIRWELEELNKALDNAVNENMSESFVALLENRINELERVLEESEGEEDLEQRLILLEKVDMKWLEKTIKSFKKESLKTYSKLKERLVEAGDLTTPAEFLKLEEKLRTLEAGGRIEYALEVMRALSEAEKYVEEKEGNKQGMDDALESSFYLLKEETLDVLDFYLREASAAKGTDYSSYFKLSEKRVNEKINDVEKAIGKEEQRTVEGKLSALNKTKNDMNTLLGQLKSESELKLKLAKNIFQANKEEMSEEKITSVENRIESIDEMVAAGNYVNALRATSTLIDEIEKDEEGPNMLLLAVTALAILAAVVAYIIKQQREKGGKKELKTLKKISKVKSGGEEKID